MTGVIMNVKSTRVSLDIGDETDHRPIVNNITEFLVLRVGMWSSLLCCRLTYSQNVKVRKD